MTELKLRSFSEGLREIVALTNYHTKPLLILIAGGTCSGKTYFAEELKKNILGLNLASVEVVPQDAYYKDKNDPAMPKDEQGSILFDLPTSFRCDDYIADIEKLMSRQEIYLPNYDRTTNKDTKKDGLTILPADIIITEGLFTIRFLEEIYHFATKVYIEAGELLRLARRIERDTKLYGVSTEAVKEKFKSKVTPYHRQFVEPQKKISDFIICSNSHEGRRI